MKNMLRTTILICLIFLLCSTGAALAQLPESPHPYSNSYDNTWSYTLGGNPTSIEVTFDAQTNMEAGYDYLYVTDGTGVGIGGSPFTGAGLAGQTLMVPGDTVKIRLVTDSSVTKWGFAVSSISEGGPPGLPESAHPYFNGFDSTWSYTLAGNPTSIEVTFDAQTNVEAGYDYLYVTDGTGVGIGGSPFTGAGLAGRRVAVPGDTVKIRLVTDSSVTAWGFKVNDVVEGTGAALPESPHPYSNNVDTTWSYTLPGQPNGIEVTFDSQSNLEANYDYLYVTDGGGNGISGSPFTATSLAGQTVNVPGDTVKIRLLTDSSVTAWGFKVTSVDAIQLTAEFSGTPVWGIAPMEISFVDESMGWGGEPPSWFWNFGDGTTSNEQNPDHVYENAGVYTVSLTVSEGSSQSTETKASYVTVGSADEIAREFTWPLPEGEFVVFQSFGNERSEFPGEYHAAVDMGVYRFDAQVRCIANGWVESLDGFGNGIMIRHVLPDGEVVYSWYNHLAFPVDNQFNVGDFVPIGTPLGTAGETGYTPSGVHLHLEIKRYSDGYGGYVTDLSDHLNPYEFILSRLTFNPAPPSHCSDGTLIGECSVTRPLHCIEGGYLVENSILCGCENGVPQTDATCSKSEEGIIVDNDDPEFGYSGDWQVKTEIMGFYGSQYLWAESGSGNATASWTPDLPEAGNYRVYGWWRDRFGAAPSTRATDAIIAINHGGEVDQVVADFSDYHKGWKFLGTYYFDQGTGNSVTLNNLANGNVVADSFRFVFDSYSAVPAADFVGSPTSGAEPLTVSFSDRSTGGISGWSWDFGDGGTSTSQNPAHEYTVAGTYTVSLTVTGPEGSDTATKVDYVAVAEASVVPAADFGGAPLTGTAPLTVAFADESTGDISTWSWDFGDGGTSTSQNPVHEYPTAGAYTVSLTVTGPGGSDTAAKVDYVDVAEAPVVPVAEFSGAPLAGTEPLTVAFADESTGDVTTWSWDFGDGGMSTAQNPVHEYPTAGAYTVSLTVTGPGGSDTATKVDYVEVAEAPVVPVAEFSGAPLAGTAPLTVAFADESTGDITTWSWDFGDGGMSTAQNPVHEYPTAGTYTVSLTVTGLGGSDTATKVDYVSVAEAPVVSVAEFSGAPLAGTEPLSVAFADESTGDVTTWSWDFGDGGTSTAQNPVHEYPTAGTYTVSLTVSGPGGSDAETKVDYVSVTTAPAMPVAAFSGSPVSGTAPLTVSFTDASTGEITGWSWDFGDGGTSTAQNPVYQYLTAGTYTVSLTVSGPGGSDAETKVDYVSVESPVELYDEVIDNGSADFSTVGSWTASTLVPGYYGSNYTWTNGGTGGSTAEWRFDIPRDGYYQTFAWWSAPYSTRSPGVPYIVYHAAGSTTVTMNQTTNGSQWNDLGVYYFTAGTNRIVMTNNAINTPVADAVRVVELAMPAADFEASVTSGRVPVAVTFTDLSLGNVSTYLWDFGDGGTSTEQNPVHTYTQAGIYTVTLQVAGADGSGSEQKVGYVVAAPAAGFEQIVDNGSAGFSTTGTWYSSTFVPGYYGSNYSWTYGSPSASTAQATWTFTLPSAGYYQVFGWWSAPYSTRSPDARYRVYHASGSTTQVVDQNVNGSQWNSLGVYYFSAGTSTVSLSNQANNNPVGDAVRMVFVTQ